MPNLFTASYAMNVFVYYILIYCKFLAIDNGMLNFHQRFYWKIQWGFDIGTLGGTIYEVLNTKHIICPSLFH